MKLKINKKGRIAIAQIIILVVAVFAFAWMVGGNIKFVSAEVDEEVCSKECNSLGATKCSSIEEDFQDAFGSSIDVGAEKTIYECKEMVSQTGTCSGKKVWIWFDTGKSCDEDSAKETGNEGDSNRDILNNAADAANIIDTTKDLLNRNAGGNLPETVEVGSDGVVQKTGNTMWESFMGGEEKAGGFFAEWLNPFSATGVGSIVSGALWAAATSGIITWTAKYYASDRNLNDITTVAWVGAGIGTAAVVAVLVIGGASGPVGWIAVAVTALFYGVYMLVGYQIYSRETFTYYTKLWQPPVGGNNCGKCNSLEFGCSEYICHSYGKACAWINDNTSYEACIETNRGDSNPPIITATEIAYGQNVFPNENYQYEFSDAGAKIVYNGQGGECVPPFTGITLAAETNEGAYCKISLERYTESDYAARFGNMMDMGEGNVNTTEHTLKLPSSVAASTSAMENAGYVLNSEGEYIFYIRCQDVQGNINPFDYVMSFCVQQGPDTLSPEVTGTSPPKDSYIRKGTLTIENFQVYLNEPADCKWDFERKSFNAMNYNFSRCSQGINDPITGTSTLGCHGNLTGFKDGIVNKYYISCIDQPWLRGTNESNKRNEMPPYEMTFIGTNDLVISDVKINGEKNGTVLMDSRNRINVELKVQTFGGAENGKARCKYRQNTSNSYSLFSNAGSPDYFVINTHNLFLEEGSYGYFIQCSDVARPAPNTATTYVEFAIETDTEKPEVVRWFRDGDNLRILTNEKAKCVYQTFTKVTTNPCIYDFDLDGIPFTSEFGEYGTSHYADWPENSQSTYYVKCEDEFGNPPPTEGCTTIVRPFEIPGLKN